MDLHLICPGLFGPGELDPQSLPPTPALDRLLARSRVEGIGPRDPMETLAGAFGLAPEPGADLPSAPLYLTGHGLRPGPGEFWFHADPAHLRPDRDRLLLFAGPALKVVPGEARALIAAFNDQFAGEGLHLMPVDPCRWCLRVPRVPRLRTWPLHQVQGRPLHGRLPTGPDARDWGRWQTEAQMLFHSLPLNQGRERRGLPALNGIWIWGGGTLPTLGSGPGVTVADHPVALGLAAVSGGRSLGLEGWGPSQGTSEGPVLVFWDRLWWPALEGDLAVWLRSLPELEILAVNLLAGVTAGRIRSLLLDDGEGHRFSLDRPGVLRFWRRGGTLHDWIRRRAPGSGSRG